MTDVERFRLRRSRRLAARERMDDEEENANNGGKKGGHGNTKLPYGLCHKYGIEIQKGWQPRDAWDALAEKGVTPGDEFAKRGSKQTTIETKLGTYKNTRVEKYGNRYLIKGDMQPTGKEGYGSKGVDNVQIAAYTNKKEMFARLKEHGITSVVDPDTGEKVNPMKMDLPKVVAQKGDSRYTDLVLGIRSNKYGVPFERKGFTLVAKDFDGKKVAMGTFDSPKQARDYAMEKLKCKKEDIRETRDYKEKVRPKIAESNSLYRHWA